jgi:hypothetical protein
MSDSDDDYSAFDLREMDEEEARQTLTVNEFQQWEKIQELYDEAEDTEQEWQEDADAVAEVTVSADMDALGTEVDIYGNDLLVHADLESPAFREATERLEDEFGDIAVENPDAEGTDAFGDVDAARLDDMGAHLLEMLDTVLVRWDGTAWADLPEQRQEAILQQAREAWGITGLLKAWGEITLAIREDYDELEARVESFRAPERRGTR